MFSCRGLFLPGIALLLNATVAGATPQEQASPKLRPPELRSLQGPFDKLRGPEQAPVPAPAVLTDEDARETRERLKSILDRYPPGLGRVLKLDPSLMTNQNYLASYPALAVFLTQHPEIARNPSYFLQHVSISGESYTPPDPARQVVDMWRNTIETVFVFVGFMIALTTLAWLLKTAIDYRRWSRLTKIQTDVHTKLLDRFASNDELLSYMQTPPGRRFLESAPIPLEAAGPRAINAPFGRILWSVQAGIGVQFVSGRSPVEVQPLLYAIGVITTALGVGFILSAVVSFVLSHRLGLFEPPPAPDRVESSSAS
jgi:hypothetical protein